MAFGGQVHDGIGLVLGKDAVEFCAVANIDLLKRVARAGAALGQRGQVARVGQLIDIDDAVARVANDGEAPGRSAIKAAPPVIKSFMVFKNK